MVLGLTLLFTLPCAVNTRLMMNKSLRAAGGESSRKLEYGFQQG